MLTEAQIKERVTYIGASEAAAVLGMSRWSSPLQVWAEKTGLISPDDISALLPVRLGNKLEQTVAELFMEETGKKVQRANETLYHPRYPFIGCNLDRRVVGESAILECKTAAPWKIKEWEGEEFPPEYVVQVMHQLAVTGAARGYLAVLFGNQDFKIKVVDRDEAALTKLVNREVEFWEKFVLPKIMPESISAKDKETLLKLFPTAEIGDPILLTDQANILAETLESLKKDHKAITAQIMQHENELKAMLGKAECGETNIWKFTWSNVPGGTHTVTRKPSRRFTFKRKGEEETNGED